MVDVRLLLLGLEDLGLDGDHLSQHDNTVSVHEGNTGETLAVLEGVDHQRLLRGEVHLTNDSRVRSSTLRQNIRAPSTYIRCVLKFIRTH